MLGAQLSITLFNTQIYSLRPWNYGSGTIQPSGFFPEMSFSSWSFPYPRRKESNGYFLQHLLNVLNLLCPLPQFLLSTRDRKRPTFCPRGSLAISSFVIPIILSILSIPDIPEIGLHSISRPPNRRLPSPPPRRNLPPDYPSSQPPQPPTITPRLAISSPTTTPC